MPEEPRKQRESLVSQGLIDKRLLALQGIDRAARRKIIGCGRVRSHDLPKQFRHYRQPMFEPSIATVLRLSKNELAAVGIVTDIEPIHALFHQRRLYDLSAGCPRVDA